MKPKITEVYCYYTGGGIYVYSAKYGDNYLYGTFDQGIDCVKVRGEILFQDEDVCKFYGWEKEMKEFGPVCDLHKNYDEFYISPDKIEYPTWKDIIDSLKSPESINVDLGAEKSVELFHPDLTKSIWEDD